LSVINSKTDKPLAQRFKSSSELGGEDVTIGVKDGLGGGLESLGQRLMCSDTGGV